jgi:catechol 2,3-dioxygenase-like lactoylglutathione lyase family enzyme
MTKAPTLKGLYHSAYACRDAGETRHFYEDILGLPLVNCMLSDHVPSTGEKKDYAHFFFEMGNGSYIAFFDLGDNEMPQPSPNTPEWVQHFAIETESVENVLAMRQRLVDAGVDVSPLVDHGFLKSIYFFDPNGIRLEVTTLTEPPNFREDAAKDAHGHFDAWMQTKQKNLSARGKA